MNKNWPIITILFLALMVRVWGIGYGLPDFTIGDEKSIVSGSLKMIELKTLIPAFYPKDFRPMYYPPLIAYIYLIFLLPVLLIQYLFSGFPSLSEFKNYLILDQTSIWLTVRAVSALFGAATIFLAYLIGNKLFSKKVGIFSAIFLTLSFFHIQLSHFARHWAAATFFATLVILFSVYLYREPKNRYYLLAGLSLGLAFGASYIAGISLIVFLLAHFLATNDSFLKKLIDKKFILALVIFIVLALIFIALHPQEFFRILFGEDSTAKQVKTVLGLLGEFFYHFKNLFLFEPIILFFSLISSIILFFKDRKKLVLLLSMPIFYILSLYFLLHSEVRYTVFIIPLFSILAGFSLNFIFDKLANFNKFFGVIFLVLVFIYPLVIAFKYDLLLIKKDTQTLAKEWIEKDISAGASIITDFYDIKLTPTKESIIFQKNLKPNSLRSEERVLLQIDDANYPAPAFNILPLHFIGENLSQSTLGSYIQEKKYNYFALDYWNKELISEKDKVIINNSELLKSFNAGFEFDIHGNYQIPIFKIFSLDNLGPTVEIYKVKK